MRYPAALPTLAFAAGIAAGIFLPPDAVPPPVFLATLTLALVAAGLALCRHARLFVLAILFGFATSGLVLGNHASGAALHTPLGDLFARHVPPGEYQMFAVIEGTLRADAAQGPNGVTLSIDVDRIELDGEYRGTSGGAIVGVGGDLASGRVAQWRAGRRVSAPVTLRRPAK